MKALPKITIYEHANFKGKSKTLTKGHVNLTDAGLNDCISSVIVDSGVWVLYQDCNYKGSICVVMEGDRMNLVSCNKDEDTLFYNFNDTVSSLKPLDIDITEDPKCTLYVHDFKGNSLMLTDDLRDLRTKNMNDKVSSIRVHNGIWVGYEDVNFGGKQTLYLPGDHMMKATDGEYNNDTLSSIRALKSKKKKKEPKITLYEHANFKGRSKTFTEAHPDMEDAGFFDCASSVIVEGGVWVLYQYRRYRGHICVVIEGDRTNLVAGKRDKDTRFQCFNDTVSSLKPLDFDCTEEPKCTVYEHDFSGRALQFTEDILDLRWYKMNDKASSIRVHSGAWVGFEGVNFDGKMTLYLPGDHNSRATDGIYRNDTLSSLRALQIKPCFPIIVDGIDYHMDRGSCEEEMVDIFSWTQKNNTDVKQKLSVSKEKTVKTEDSYEFRWEKGTKVSAEVSFETSIPFTSMNTSMKLGAESFYNIGSNERKKTGKTETWTVHYPSEIPSKSTITLTSSLRKGKMDVPYTASFHQGDKKWTEKGTFHGINYFGFQTEFKQT
ncbi:epidermal differentiation-specific protein-like [Mytilus edulis]|uniref:epidermal differentiation-specific protein-like n=1 Tax=Mytilus edulis TaxID=6550 RepID=UPI0039EEA2F2